MQILFIADQYTDAPRTSDVRHPGGAELTDAAALAACPEPVDLCKFSELDVDVLAHYDLIVVGNSGSATRAQLAAIAKTGRHVSFEHDLRICGWRGNYPASPEPAHRFAHYCACPHPALQRFYARALGVVYLTALQQRRFESNPFFAGAPSAILGCSLFDTAFFERVEHRNRGARSGTAIFGSRHRVKGFQQAYDYTMDHGYSPLVIRDIPPPEVLDVFEESERFVYLPLGPEWAGRMPVEARFLGCEVVTNAKVGVAGEPWWRWPDEDALAYLRDGAERFWRIVFSFGPK